MSGHRTKDLDAENAALRRAQRVARVGALSFSARDGDPWLSEEARELLGLAGDAPSGAGALLAAIHPDDRSRAEAALRAAGTGAGVDLVVRAVVAGEPRWLRLCAAAGPDPADAPDVAGSVQDVTELTTRDPATGLPNGHLLLSRLGQALEAVRAEGRPIGLAVLNLDRFSQVNEALGRAAGDVVLATLGSRLRDTLGPSHLVTALGGDRFAALLTGIDGAHDALALAARLVEAVKAPVMVPRGGVPVPVSVTVSIGLSLAPDHATEAEELLHDAEDAMRVARGHHGNRIELFDRHRGATVVSWFETENALRSALAGDELFLDFQPQVDVLTGRVVGVEALVRWRRNGTVVPPGGFIHVVEGTDLALPVSGHILEMACRQGRAWMDRQHPLRIAVNVFTSHVSSGQLVADVRKVLSKTGLPPRLLELELVESSFLTNPEGAARTLRELSDLGVSLALDDFGTGYSSLSYLKHYPFDVVKIDQVFARNVSRDPDDAAIVRSTVSLAHELGMRVLAEGVETMAQLRFLVRYGCDQAQGYLLGRPAAPHLVEAVTRERRDLRPAGSTDILPSHGVLVIDDDPLDRDLVARVLEREGYRTSRAANVEEALDQLGNQRIDLILCDYSLAKGVTGVEVLERLRGLYPDVVRIMLSGTNEQLAVIEAVNRGGVEAFLPKGIEPRELLQTVRERLRARAALPEARAWLAP